MVKMLKPRVAPSSPTRLKPATDGGDERLTANQRGYTYQWQIESKAWLVLHPYCAYCYRDEGRVERATLVDHITPHQGNKALFWDKSNWQSLCKPCHDVKKSKEERQAGYR